MGLTTPWRTAPFVTPPNPLWRSSFQPAGLSSGPHIPHTFSSHRQWELVLQVSQTRTCLSFLRSRLPWEGLSGNPFHSCTVISPYSLGYSQINQSFPQVWRPGLFLAHLHFLWESLWSTSPLNMYSLSNWVWLWDISRYKRWWLYFWQKISNKILWINWLDWRLLDDRGFCDKIAVVVSI